jgi:hypothetical protein
MKRSFFSIFLIASSPSAFAATFSERVATAKDVETQKETQIYFKNIMYPSLGPELRQAMQECTSLPNANIEKFTVVADITQEGKFVGIEFEPKTDTAACLAKAMTTFHSPPPPTCDGGSLPIVMNMTVTP